MDALQDATFAPLDVVVVGGCRMFEGSANEEALHLHGEEGLEDCGGLEVESVSERAGGGWSENL